MAGRGKVLISGASIAGPVCAYWLHRAGFDVSLVERSSAPRTGGYGVDIRGPAITVLEWMGLLDGARRSHVNMPSLTFVNRRGKTLADISMTDLMGAEEGDNLEIPRGSLSNLFFEATREQIDYRFNDSIVTLSQDAKSVEVRFASGKSETFDIVISAEGLHSNTRQLIFGPEEPLVRHMGYVFGIFTMPNIWSVGGTLRVFSETGRACALYAVDAGQDVNAMLTVAVADPPYDLLGDPEKQRAFFTRHFADAGGDVPKILEALQGADDLFCDLVSQIHSPRWSERRVALIGDAAAAPSFMTGQGTSLAIVEAYMLAQALAEHDDHRVALVAYEKRCRPFVERNQALAQPGGWGLIPRTRRAALMRRIIFRLLPLLRRVRKSGEAKRKVHTSLSLPAFPGAATGKA